LRRRQCFNRVKISNNDKNNTKKNKKKITTLSEQTMENSMGSLNYMKSCANGKLNSRKFKN